MDHFHSRRSFLTTSIKVGIGAAVSASIDLKHQGIVARTITPQRFSSQAAAMQSHFVRLDEFVTRHMRETGVPGLTLALANKKGLIRASTYGFADTKAHLRVVPETLFEIGSISKSFVALALLQLREEGKLDFNRPVLNYLPWLKLKSSFEPITTHHILSHTSGLPGVPLLRDSLLSEIPVIYGPGKRFLYSNTGYNILGFLIEAIDKRPFSDAIRERLLRPLDMSATFPVITNDTRRLMAIGYKPLLDDRPFPRNGPLGEAQWMEVDLAAGSIASTPTDMAKYIRMLINHGELPKGKLVSAEAFNLFIKPEVNSPFRGEDASYGYGLWISDIGGHTRLRHTGGMVAFSSSIDADVTSGIGAFASVNAGLEGYRPVPVTKYAVELLNASLKGISMPDPPPPPAAADRIENAGDYAGTYTSPDDTKLVLEASGNKLMLVHKNQRITLERSGRDLFLVKHPDFELFLLGFVRESEKVVEAFHGANWYAGAAYSGPRTFNVPNGWESYPGHYFNDSAWYGDTRVVLRKGQLFMDGVQRLISTGEGRFATSEESPDWITFDSDVDGRAMRMNYSGMMFRRVFTP
jgi:CubicO group peptidase (beta-lactamase class C family)